MTLANPDFLERLRVGAPLNTADRSAYFGVSPDGYAAGYTDFPPMGA